MSDSQLIQEQTIENGVRENLSWIEKALWADQLKSTGIKQREMTSLLGISESEVSRLFKVLSSLPVDLIRVVGRADGIGRPSWMDLAEKLKASPEKLEKALVASKADGFREMDSPDRFNHLLKSIGTKLKVSSSSNPDTIETRIGGKLVCSARTSNSGIQICISKSEKSFGEWLHKSIERLYVDYVSQQSNGSADQETS